MRRNVAPGKDRDDSIGVIHAAELRNEAVIARYINTMRAAKKSPRTIKARRELLHRLGDYLDPTPLVRAEPEQLFDWQISISSLATGSVANYVAGVRVFYHWLVLPMHWLDISPAEELTIPKVPGGVPRPIPEADFQYALTGCADPMLHIWLELGRYAGLRCCEIAWLTRDRVLDDPPRLRVLGKGSKERIVFIPQSLLDELRPWMNRQGAVFLNRVGRPFQPDTVSDRLADFFKQLGLPYTAHQLRHQFGSDGYRRTKNLRLMQGQLGHASPATTQLYTQIHEPDAISLAAELDADLRKRRGA